MATVLSKEEYQLNQRQIEEVLSLEDRLTKLVTRLSRLDRHIERLEKDEADATDNLVEAENALQSATDELTRISNDTTSTADELSDAEQKFIEAKKEYEKAKGKRDRVSQLLVESTSRRESLEEDRIEVNTKYRNSKKNLNDALGRRTFTKDLRIDHNERESDKKRKTAQKEKETKFASKIGNVAQIVQSISDIFKEWYQASVDIQLKGIETMTKVQADGLKMQGKALSNAISSSLKAYEGVNQGAYAASQVSVESAMNLQDYLMGKEEALLSQKNFNEVRNTQALASSLKSGASIIGASIGLAAGGPIGAAVGAGIGMLVGVIGDWMVMTKESDAKISEATLKATNEIKKTTIEQAQSATQPIRELSQSIESRIEKHQANAMESMKSVGYNTEYKKTYESNFFKMQRGLGYTTSDGKFHHYDKNGEDMAKWQTAYAEQSGRAVPFGQIEYNKMAGLGQLMGDDNAAVSLASHMELFNHSVESSTDMFYEMYKLANRIGISNQKYSKELLKNLHLAERYQFKGGVEGLAKMTAWAQKVRFNMESLDGALSGIHDGGLEGIITKSAQLQVLGGNFAMGSDPLRMLWQSYNDPQGFAENLNNMVSGLGFFNSSTGEAELSQGDQMRIETYAKTMGLDPKDVNNQIRQRIKGEHVEKQLDSNKRWNDDQKALITNKAKYNRETKRYEIEMGDGHDPIDVANLTDNDILQLMPVEERMEDHLKAIRSYTQEMAGVTEYGNTKMEIQTRVAAEGEWDKRMTENIRFFNTNTGALKEMIEEQMKFTTEQNKLQHQIMENSGDILTAFNRFVKKSTEKLIDDLNGASSSLITAINIVTDSVGAISEVSAANDSALRVINGLATEDDYRLLAKHPEARDKYLTEEQIQTVYNNAHISRSSDWVNGEKDPQAISRSQSQKKGNEDAQYDASGARTRDILMEEADKARQEGGFWGFLKNMFLTGATAGTVYAMDAVSSASGTPMAIAASSVTPIHDGAVSISSSNDSSIKPTGKSLAVPASSVTPIHDGTTIAKTDPNDHAIFAKVGGPFDTLFNGVFGRINEIYESLLSPQYGAATSKSPRKMSLGDRIREYQRSQILSTLNESSMEMYERLSGTTSPISPLPMPQAMPMQIESGQVNSANTSPTNGSTHIDFSNLKVDLSGELRLTAPNGQSIDILKELQNNPSFLRDLTKYISEGISRQINGGRSISNGGRMVSF